MAHGGARRACARSGALQLRACEREAVALERQELARGLAAGRCARAVAHSVSAPERASRARSSAWCSGPKVRNASASAERFAAAIDQVRPRGSSLDVPFPRWQTQVQPCGPECSSTRGRVYWVAASVPSRLTAHPSGVCAQAITPGRIPLREPARSRPRHLHPVGGYGGSLRRSPDRGFSAPAACGPGAGPSAGAPR